MILLLADAQEIEAIVLKAHGDEFPQPPGRIGRNCTGVTQDAETARKTHDGSRLVGWSMKPATAYPGLDGSGEPTGDATINVASVASPTEAEIPDPTERAAETARVNARLARLTAQERATVAQALGQGAEASPNRRTR